MFSSSRTVFALALLATQVSANCMHNTYLHRREEGKVAVSTFGYTGATGPLNWAALDSKNAKCASSKLQSPIVIDDSIPFATEAPKVNFTNVEETEFENLGSTIEVVAGGTTAFAGKVYMLKQFHFHTPSEHRINDEYYPLEVHMVHETADGDLAVIALPFELTEDGSSTALLTNVVQNIQDIAEPGTVTKTGPLDFGAVANALQTTKLYQYTGSLTTPPCSDGLTFLVLSEPLPLNVATYKAIKKTVKFNARYSQNKPGERNLLDMAAEEAAKENSISNAQCVVVPDGSTSPLAMSTYFRQGFNQLCAAVCDTGSSSSSSATAIHAPRMMRKPLNRN